jgi:hypothetical protein
MTSTVNPAVSDVERSAAEASKLLARGPGDLNLQIVGHKLSRSSLLKIAEAARKAADTLDRIAKRHRP